jgi:hypothetical protein
MRSDRGKIVRSVVATWAIVVLAQVVVAAPQGGSAGAKVAEIKLEAFGWQPPVPPHPGRIFWRGGSIAGINSEIDSLPSQKLTIDSKGRVLVSFTVRGPNEGLRRRSKPGLRLRIVRFTTSGRVDLSLALPTDNWLGNGVYVDERDRIIVRADEKIQMLVGTDDNPEWKVLAACGPHCMVWQSLTRRTLYLHYWDFSPPVTILDMTDQRQTRHCWLPRWAAPDSITDDFAYSYFSRDPGPPIGTNTVSYRWPLCEYSRRTKFPVAGPLMLAISDDLFLLGRHEYGSSGKLRHEISIRLAKHEDSGVTSMGGISENGHRLAFTVTTWKGGFAPLDIGSHLTAERVIVYDVAVGKELASIPIRPMNALLRPAISPDGHRVAALVKDKLTIADVP